MLLICFLEARHLFVNASFRHLKSGSAFWPGPFFELNLLQYCSRMSVEALESWQRLPT